MNYIEDVLDGVIPMSSFKKDLLEDKKIRLEIDNLIE